MDGISREEYGNMKHQALSNHGDYGVTFNVEDGKAFIGYHFDSAGIEKHCRQMTHAMQAGGKTPGGMNGQYIGSIPPALLATWLRKHGFTMHHFAINAGGERLSRNPDPYAYKKDPGVRSQFLRYYLSRDFSKMHTHHVTTRVEHQKIWLPGDPK